MSIRSSVGAGGVNRSDDTRYVQNLLNRQKGTSYSFGPIAVDGLVGPQTIGAITNYQARVVGFSNPDGRVDPGYQTIAALEKNAAKATGVPWGPKQKEVDFTVTFRHGGQRPPNNNSFESRVWVNGPNQGSFQGSIFPDDMSKYGRIKDGEYQLYLGFHKRGGKTPTGADLRVKYGTQLLRPALIVANDRAVPVMSDNPSKTTSDTIHIHNAQCLYRASEGCLTISVVDWARFIGLFLDAYPNLDDWFSVVYPGGVWEWSHWFGQNRYVGKRIGTLRVAV